MSREKLAQLLAGLPESKDENLLVGANSFDDSSVYRLSPDLALVQSVDFFPPMVDEPFVFGQIAAANAVSDIYAMGGRPLTALNIVCFPDDKLPLSVLSDILKGGQMKMEEAGAIITGGHTVKDREVKYGLAVTGIINPEKLFTNSKASLGDSLVLTKPIGTGILTTVIKKASLSPYVYDQLIGWMIKLNKIAAETLLDPENVFKINAVTDVTGFSLLGHSYNLVANSGLALEIIYDKIPIFDNLENYLKLPFIPGGTFSNLVFVKDKICLKNNSITEEFLWLLGDPQTSGGLLISMPEDEANRYIKKLEDIGEKAWIIGRIIKPKIPDKKIFIV